MKFTTASEVDLGHEKVGKLLFMLAVPAILSQIVNLLYNVVDRMYIGHIQDVGAIALTGVGVCLPIIMIVSAFACLVGITSLEQKGLITLKKVSENRRISYIELTEEAIPILAKISIEIDKINQVLFKDIPIKDIQCMIDTMNKMNEKIEGAK